MQVERSKKVSGWKGPRTTSLRVTASEENSQMKVVEDFESRPHKAVSFVVEREKEIQEWYEQKLPKVLLGSSGGRLPMRSEQEQEEEEKDSRERQVRYGIAQELVAGIKEKADVHEDAKSTAQRTVGQSVKQSWDCSQIENEEEEEEVWQKANQMEMQWAEDDKLKKSLERRRMEESSFQAEVMQKVPELVVHERITQGEEF